MRDAGVCGGEPTGSKHAVLGRVKKVVTKANDLDCGFAICVQARPTISVRLGHSTPLANTTPVPTTHFFSWAVSAPQSASALVGKMRKV
jgi:hypothetical protein